LNWKAWIYDYGDTKSNFCFEEGAKKWLKKIINNTKCKFLLLSYNNNWLIKTDEIYKILSNYGNTDLIIIDYPVYRAHSDRTPFSSENYEYLFICRIWSAIDENKYDKNILFLESHPWYNRRRKCDSGRFVSRKWI
jgi:adenine-specific DNA methylase